VWSFSISDSRIAVLLDLLSPFSPLAERGPMLRTAETSPLYHIMPNGGNYYLHKFIFHLLLKSGSLLLFCTIIHMTKCPNSSVPSKQQTLAK
jgi:hypothetical protein